MNWKIGVFKLDKDSYLKEGYEEFFKKFDPDGELVRRAAENIARTPRETTEEDIKALVDDEMSYDD